MKQQQLDLFGSAPGPEQQNATPEAAQDKSSSDPREKEGTGNENEPLPGILSVHPPKSSPDPFSVSEETSASAPEAGEMNIPDEPQPEIPAPEGTYPEIFFAPLSESQAEELIAIGLIPDDNIPENTFTADIDTVPDTPMQVNPPAAQDQAPKRGRKSNKLNYTPADEINIPSDEVLASRLYYPISEVASWFGVAASQIRFWENEFDILKPRKNRKGDRLFRAEDIKNLRLIYYLLRNRKFSIQGAKDYLASNSNKTEMHLQLAQSLGRFRSFLLELKTNLD